MKTLGNITIVVVMTALGLAVLRFVPGVLVNLIPISWGNGESLGIQVLLGLLPYAAVGAGQGLATAKLIRPQRPIVAMLPSILLCVYEVCVFLFGGYAGSLSAVFEISRWVTLLLASAVATRALSRTTVR